MRRREGIILAIRGRTAVVLSPDGTFLWVPVPEGAAVGQAVPVPARPGWRRAWAVALAAALLLAALVPALVLYPRRAEAVAVLSMDVGAWMDLEVDRRGRFAGVAAAEPRAAPVLETLEAMRGRPVSQVVQAAVEEARRLGLLSPETPPVLVLALFHPVHRSPELDRQAEEIRRWAAGQQRAAAGVVDEAVRAAAAQRGLGLAQALRRVAEHQGVEVSELLRRLDREPNAGPILEAIRRLPTKPAPPGHQKEGPQKENQELKAGPPAGVPARPPGVAPLHPGLPGPPQEGQDKPGRSGPPGKAEDSKGSPPHDEPGGLKAPAEKAPPAKTH